MLSNNRANLSATVPCICNIHIIRGSSVSVANSRALLITLFYFYVNVTQMLYEITQVRLNNS